MDRRSFCLTAAGLFLAASAWCATRADDDAFTAAIAKIGEAYAAADKAAFGKAVTDAETAFAGKDALYTEIVGDYRAVERAAAAQTDAAAREKTRLAVYKEAELLLAKKDYPRTGALLADLCAAYPGDRDVFGVLTAYHRSRLGKDTAAVPWQETFAKVLKKKRETPAAAAVPAVSDEEKRKRLASARDLIVSQDYAGALRELDTLKAMLPKDREVGALHAYALAQRDASAAAAKKDPKAMPPLPKSPAASQGVARDLYYDGVRLYNEKKYKDAGRRFKQVIDLEEGSEEEYAPRARKVLAAMNGDLHKQVLTDILTDDDVTDEMVLRHIDGLNTPPYLDPAKETAPRKRASLVEMPEVRKKLEKRMSFDFSDIGIRHVADYIETETGVSIVLSQKVLEQKVRVTAKFDDLSAYEAMRYMFKSADLAFRLEEDAVWVATNGEMDKEPVETRVYRLKHGAGLLTEFATTESSQAGVSSFASFKTVETLEDTLKAAVDWPSGGKVLLDKRTNSLIVSNTPKNLQTIEDILYKIDEEPIQILVESRFIEVDVTDLKELGAEWKFNSDLAVTNKGGSLKTGVSAGSGLDFTDFANAAQGFNLTYKGVLTDPQFQVVLHALEKSDKTKTLSSPRVTTMNNQMATMKVVDEWVYPTKYEFQQVQVDTDGDGIFQADEIITQNVPVDFVRRDVGIILKVIPSVGSDNKTVSMSVIPEVSEATADYFDYSGGVKMPKFSSRNLATSVAVDSGQTVVLGGLIKESRINNKTKTPILGDIPLLGRLFRKESESIQRRSLLIFVTAKILTPSGKEVATE